MPAGTALFSNSSRNQNKNLLEFKAGKMSMKGKTVYPDKRKGVVYIYQSEDSLIHFCWRDRSSGTVEDDLIIFPDDVEFKHVPQCTTGRVYLLKFKSSSRKFFFWVQEPKTDKDEENCRKVNEILNNPPAMGSQRSGGTTPDCDLQNLLSNMSQQQLMQLFGGVGQIGGLSNLLSHINRPSSSGGSGSSATSTASTPAIAAAGSKSAASSGGTANTNAPANTTPQKSASTPPSNVDLSSSMTSETLSAILGDASLVQELERHLPSLPSDSGNAQNDRLRSTLASPQFQQAVSMFSSALQSGQLAPIVSQFEVGDEAVNAAAQGNLEEFVKALEAANISGNKQSSGSSSTPPTKDKKEEDAGDEDGKEKKGGAVTPSKPPEKKDDDDFMSLD